MSTTKPGSIETRILLWLEAQGLAGVHLTPLAGDVSARRYFRAQLPAGARRIVAVYPPELAGAHRRFGLAAALLGRAGVRVPMIYRDDYDSGFSLLEDLGERTLYERSDLDRRAREGYLTQALASARRIAALPLEPVAALGSPALDPALLWRELEATIALYLAPRGLASPEFQAGLAELCRCLGELSPVPCHRDFMVRNLVPTAEGDLAVLDFQDLRLGPPAYDLASLLNDSWFASSEFEEEVLEELCPGESARLAYRRAVVQRALKAVGTFTAFAARGEGRHLPLVAPTLARAERHLGELPETAAAFAALRERWPSQDGSADLLH